MNPNVKALLGLVRYRNLLIVVATQYLMRHAIIAPVLGIYGLSLQLGEFNFFLLVLSTLMITAAGYVINDYFDTRTDLLNRPGKVIIGRQISRRTAIKMHWALNFTGIITGFYVAFRTGVPLLGLLFVFVAGLLWFYSTTYNRQFLIGNLVIASLTAMVPVTVILFEIPLLNREYGEFLRINNTTFGYVFAWVGSFGYFAFFTTLIRELVKDIEDYEGDMAQGRKSVPIVIGVPSTKLLVAGIISVVIISLVYLFKAYLMIGFFGDTDYLSLMYFAVFLFFPLLLLAYKVAKADKKSDYTFAHSLAKLTMLFGLMYSLLVRYIIVTSF
jgi:4-hydroxybenzoate polyprenyltransferase